MSYSVNRIDAAMTPGRENLLPILDAPRASAIRPLFGLCLQQLKELLQQFEAAAYRARQLSQALYANWTDSLDAISTLPRGLRDQLTSAGYHVGLPSIVETYQSVDGTERYLIATGDGQTVETVWMPEGDDGERGDGSETGYHDSTICVSSQIGCAVNCQFCLTAKLGIIRNLTAGEIAGQVVAVLKRHNVQIGRDRINLVFMGMGEPFLNYDAFMDAVRLLVHEVGIAESRMTVSTSGIMPGILRFAEEPVRPKLAISLNALQRQGARTHHAHHPQMGHPAPGQRRPPGSASPQRELTFEYVLLGGVNDRPEHADEVAASCAAGRPPRSTSSPGIPARACLRHAPSRVSRGFQKLIADGIPAFIRRPRGRDIYAACGQLKQTIKIQNSTR